VRLDYVRKEDGSIIAVALMEKERHALKPIPVSPEVSASLSAAPDCLDSLIDLDYLFDAHTGDEPNEMEPSRCRALQVGT
jgi:hypothetical protein